MERYTVGYSDGVLDHHAHRTADECAAFLLPYLQAGMHVLDCGCGPGTITIGLADAVAPGMVTGIDIEPSVIAIARQNAAEKQCSNVSFEVADVYALPFSDDSFDAVFVHNVLIHLHSPADALREIHRVLRSGGILGLRDDDWGGMIIAPSNQWVELGWILYEAAWRANGGNPYFGRWHRAALRDTGFSCIKASASVMCRSTKEETAAWARVAEAHFNDEGFIAQIASSGIKDPAIHEKVISNIRLWGVHPDAFFALPMCETVAMKL